MGDRVSHQLVRDLWGAAGCSLQANRKTSEGPPHPDRRAQVRHITPQVRQCQAAGQPGAVRVRGFLIPARGKAVPYGVYDLTRTAGWVSVGIDHETAFR